MSETLYFGVSFGNLIYPNSTSTFELIGVKKHGILFSSDVTRACYDLNTIASALSPKTISFPGSLSFILNPFILDSSLTLITEALTVVPLDLAGVN